MATLLALAETFPLARPFTISRGSKTEATVVRAVVEARIDGCLYRGEGEGVPYPRYGESVDGVLAELNRLREPVEGGLDRAGLKSLLRPGAARNALDCAMWDLEAKKTGKPAWVLAGLPRPQACPTCETIGLDSPSAMAAAASDLADRPLLKVKLGTEGVLDRLAAVRQAAPAARLVVDANEAWTFELLQSLMGGMVGLGVEMIEQPLTATQDAALEGYDSPITLCADESCHGLKDLDHLARRYGMINVKLDKAGGLTAALELTKAARQMGLKIMIGCMVGTSLAMAPAFLLSPLADIIDLDGPIWLARDREPAIAFHGGIMQPPSNLLWG